MKTETTKVKDKIFAIIKSNKPESFKHIEVLELLIDYRRRGSERTIDRIFAQKYKEIDNGK